jgi:hypothetical protein
MWWVCVKRSISARLFRRLSIWGRATALGVRSMGRFLGRVGEEFTPTDVVEDEEEEEEEEIIGVLGGCEVQVKVKLKGRGPSAVVGAGAGGGGGGGAGG